MNFSNAKVGFQKLFNAELLMIAAEIVSFFIIQLWWLFFVASILIIVSFFMNLSGLKLISKDHEGYSKAYIWAIIGIIITIGGMICLFVFQKGTTAYKYSEIFLGVGPKVADYLTIYFVLSTSVNVAKSLNNVDLAVDAQSTLKLHLIVYALSILLSLALKLDNIVWIIIPMLIVALVDLVLAIIAKVKYYIFLKKMANSL